MSVATNVTFECEGNRGLDSHIEDVTTQLWEVDADCPCLPLQFMDFLEGEYLKEQVDAIKEISDHVTNLKRVGPGLGEYMYDKESLES